MRRHLFGTLLIAGAVLLLGGCDSSDPGADERVVAGIDFGELFAPASPAELQTVRSDWSVRGVGPVDVTIVHETSVLMADSPAIARVVSHRVAGVLHYGAVVAPVGAAAGSLPVLMYLHGGDAGVSVDGEALFLLGLLGGLEGYVVVVPSFRDEPLSIGDQVFQSEGPASPWDYDVDDAMSLLSIALESTPAADPERIALFGVSRGGGVALLMGARDPRVDAVVDFMGPTDFFGPFVQDVTEETLLGNPRNLPGLDYLNATFLVPLREGDLGIGALRVELARRSSILFLDQLPPVQVHHGRADTVVPVSQAEALIDAMDDAGAGVPQFEAFLYDDAGHNPFQMPFAFDRAAAFLASELN